MARNAYLFLLLVLFLAALSGGVLLLLRHTSRPAVEVLPPAARELKVYISGAVASPGVYSLREGDRLEDALRAAGGPLEDADISRVNLALRVKDQDHFHIPRVGEALAPSTGGKIDINTAPVELLETLPGIGRVKAQAIVRYREEKGPFRSVEELLNVEGIGPVTYERLRELVTVGEGAR